MSMFFGIPKVPALPTPPAAPTLDEAAKRQEASERARLRVGSASNYLTNPAMNTRKEISAQQYLGGL